MQTETLLLYFLWKYNKKVIKKFGVTSRQAKQKYNYIMKR